MERNIERAFSPLLLEGTLYLGLRPRLVSSAPLALMPQAGIGRAVGAVFIRLHGVDGARSGD